MNVRGGGQGLAKVPRMDACAPESSGSDLRGADGT